LFKGYVSISVEQAQTLKSPVYDVGMSGSELDQMWLKTYIELLSNR